MAFGVEGKLNTATAILSLTVLARCGGQDILAKQAVAGCCNLSELGIVPNAIIWPGPPSQSLSWKN